MRGGCKEEMKVFHDFGKSLAESHEAEDLPFWKACYQKAFPTMVAMVCHRKNGDHQRHGIDRSITLENSKQILIDEKVRGRNKITGVVYEDISLEYLSDAERGVPGWVCKPLLADYIAYAIAPIGKCYLLPVQQLQQAWRDHPEWMKRFTIVAKNEYRGRHWETHSKPVKVKELFQAIGKCLRVEFEPCEVFND